MTRRPNIEDIVAEQIKLYRNDVSMTSHRIARIILRKIRKLLPAESKQCKHPEVIYYKGYVCKNCGIPINPSAYS